MVTLSEFKENVKTLLKQYLYTKEETRQNFDNFIRTKIGYTNGIFHINEEVIVPSFILWQPELNGETGADYAWSYSEANGEAIGKGFIFHNGFDNVDNWELTFDFKHDNIRYTGICFIAELGTYNGKGNPPSTALTTWEGSWSGGERYATYTAGAVGYFDVKVTKIDSTHVRLQSETLNRDTTVEVPWLASATKLSFGARHNTSSSYGPCRIKNIKVEKI